ncbi:MAG: patatin-like phospholipase family protein [Chloroflexi bacterium]|nr:patatin-like phospholipase family protein [Chloroflexota bacterium]
MSPLVGKRIGLVLSGGGAKGAYQVGSLKMLRQAGVAQFAAIAGTSVGSLNACLVAADKLVPAERLWRTIHWKKVLRINWRRSWLLPVWLVCTLYRLRFGAPATRHPDPVIRWLAQGSTISMFALLVLSVTGILGDTNPVVAALQKAWHMSPSLIIWLVALGLLASFHESVAQIVLRWLATSNDPLRDYVDRELKPTDFGRIRAPLYATVSRLRPYTITSMDWGGWVPEYLRIDRMDQPTALQALLQSAGLPGIFLVRKVLGEDAIDGGLTDNTPVAPLLYDQEPPLDIVFVIYLQPKGSADYQPPVEAAEVRWNAHQQTRPGENQARQIDKDFLDNKRGVFSAIPVSIQLPQIVEVFPSRPLGNFLTGTLNFTAQKAHELIKLGEDDTRDVLRSHGWWKE